MIQMEMETLKSQGSSSTDRTRNTPPASPLSAPRPSPGAGAGGSRTYSQYTSPWAQGSSSRFVQSNLHHNNHSRPLSSSSEQQQQIALQERISSSRPASRRSSISGLFPAAETACSDEETLADTGDSDYSRNERMKEEEWTEIELEEGEHNHPKQVERAPPLMTANTTRASSPLLTLFSASHSPCSSTRSSVSSSSSSSATYMGTPKRVLTPPLYLNEEAMEVMSTMEALAVFQDRPILTTPQEYARAVAWEDDTCTRTSYVTIKGSREPREIRTDRTTGEIVEEYEMQDLKFKRGDGERI
ncbi:hypothetical protein PG996_007082 [Apiospora saccharicola]|uniref:Uncharacterized protein n=1 Tax=Apiospora saccharicola TaxID=335842 RepID=A0ABR1VCJ9_9PEZI